MNEKTAQIIAAILQVLGALPLIAYPAMIAANIMMFAAPPNPKASRLLLTVIRTFLAGTTAYPVVFLLCLLGARRALGQGKWEQGLALSSLPLMKIAAMCSLMALWGRLEEKK